MNKMRQTDTSQEQKYVSFPIIVDEEVAAYIEQQGIVDINDYMNRLLEQEKQRQQTMGNQGQPAEISVSELDRGTPDTSGYPEMQGHFYRSFPSD